MVFMIMTLYFAEINPISKDVYKLYENPALRKERSVAMYASIISNPIGAKKNVYFNKLGSHIARYLFASLFDSKSRYK